MKKLVSLMMLALFFVSCGHKKDAKDFMAALEAETGHDYEIAKLHTETGKYVVYKNKTTGEYEAYNMKKWDRKENSSYSEFLANGAVAGVDIVLNLDQKSEYIEDGYWQDEYIEDYDYYEYYDEWCECWVEDYTVEYIWVGSYWVDTSYWYTYYTGGGFRFSNTQNLTKDLETLASLKEDIQEGLIAQTLKSDFKLSVGRSKELAKLVTQYQKLESARALTGEEKDKFALDALGVSVNKIENALKAKAQGNEGEFTSLLEEASKVNQTTPEQIGRFFDEYVTDGVL